MLIDRRRALAGSLLLLAACKGSAPAASAGAAAKGGLEDQADMTLGDPAAKVTMIEYHSVACPTCRIFATTVWPAFRAKYIDSGKVYYISREALTHDASLAASGFLVAHCAGDDRYFAVVDTLYQRQPELEAPGADVRGGLLNIARSAGLTEAQFTACVNDEAAYETLNTRYQDYKKVIAGTPAIFINGYRMPQVVPSLTDLDAAVSAAATGKTGDGPAR